MRRRTTAVVLIAFVGTLFGCGDDEKVLDDQEAHRLVQDVLADLDLPGEPEPPIDPAEIPEGELDFGFHCQIQSAGFDIDDVLVAFPRPKIGHEEFPGGDIERVAVAILVFDTAASASAVLAAYEVEGTADCLSRTFSEPVDVEADDSLEAGGVKAEGFAISIGVGDIQPEGHRTFAVVVGRNLVDVTVLAPNESRGRELTAETLGDVVDALQAGGA
jgi:hypothetical protein